jgi:hypothetical protein
LRDRPLEPFTIEERIGIHNYILKLPTTIRLHLMFHVNNLKPLSTSSLRFDVPVNVPQGDDEELDVSHIFVVRIKSLP